MNLLTPGTGSRLRFDMRKLRILVTGANGFIGGAILRNCLAKDITAYAHARRPEPTFWSPSIPWFTGSLADVPELIRILKETEPTHFVHCAGAASVPFSTQHPAVDFRNSTQLVSNVLEAIRLSKIHCCFGLISSAAVYGNPAVLPITEDSPINPLSPYGTHRYLNEILLSSYKNSYGLSGFTGRIFSAYGEGLQKQVVYDAMIKLAFGEGDECAFHGSGSETRDFVHVDDVANAILTLCRRNGDGIYNIASGEQVTIQELIATIQQVTETTKRVLFSGTARTCDPSHWSADISRITALGYQKQIELEEGLRRVWQWIQKNYPKGR